MMEIGREEEKQSTYKNDETTVINSLHSSSSILSELKGVGSESELMHSEVHLSEQQSQWLISSVKYLNLLIAMTATIYFAEQNLMNIALQYAQIAFLSGILLSLDAGIPLYENLYLFLVFLLAVQWATIVFIGIRIGYPIENFIVGGFSAFFNFGGIIYCVYIINVLTKKHPYKCVEVDLLLYLAAMNAISLLSDNNAFNDNLHLILDLRNMLLLYAGLYRPKDKMKLLRLPRFLIVIIGMIGAFLLFSTETITSDLLGNIIYILVGMILFYEGYRAQRRSQS